MEEAYKPISCSFYDRLEAAATQKKKVDLQYFRHGSLVSLQTTIKTLHIRNKVEYMVLEDDSEIRLDKIHAIDKVELQNHC